MPVAQALEALSQAANGPIFGTQEHQLGSGITGGDLIQLDVLAGRAATLAARILKGEAPSKVAPIREPASIVAFDARQLKRWNIAERRLPAGSTVRFRERTLWTEYRWHVLGATALLVGQALLIGGLVVQRRQRQRAQASLSEAEHRYRTIADFATDWEYWMRTDGSLLFVSPSCERVTGYDAAAFLSRPELLDDLVLDEDRDSWRQHRSSVQGLPAPSSLQFRIRTRDGETRWIEHVCSGVTGPDGSDQGRRASNRDITERKQAEEDLRRALRENEELRDRLEIDISYMREQLHPEGIEGILGTSDAMRYVTSRVQQVAPTASTVLLLGETGVGKSLLAQAIHDLSPRRARPLVTLNCAALPPALVESELFGHEKGAFTGAQARRLGRFEIADGGTLFLDEVAELPLDLQAKLLRAVQDGTFERVGSSVTLKTDVRLIAATNRKLDDEVRAGRFRQDLLYRLNVFPITVPPLRQRPDDIPPLVGHLVQKHCRKLGVAEPPISKATMKALQAREWPGNIRELENVVERALISSRGTRFEIGDEPVLAAAAGPDDRDPSGRARTLAQLERDHVIATLERLHWRIEGPGGAADVLGINASTLRSRMRKHGIRRPGGYGVAPIGGGE
jgi:PAS domain S-box-containing protein